MDRGQINRLYVLILSDFREIPFDGFMVSVLHSDFYCKYLLWTCIKKNQAGKFCLFVTNCTQNRYESNPYNAGLSAFVFYVSDTDNTISVSTA